MAQPNALQMPGPLGSDDNALAADAWDANRKAYADWLAQDRQRQIAMGYVDPQTGQLTPEGWKAQAQTIAGGFGPADVGVAGNMLGTIKAYHGSPHSFERFNMSKIGTGEGAQAYGHGLYFAENEGVARGYRDALTRTDAPLYQGKPIGRGDEAYDVGSWMNAPLKPGETMEDYLWRRADAVEEHGKFLRRGTSRQDQEASGMYFEAAKKLKAQNPADWSFPQGHMYEVNLAAEPEQMLHWDKPLSEQSPYVQQKLAGLGFEPHGYTVRQTDSGYVVDMPGGKTSSRIFQTAEDAQRAAEATASMQGKSPTGAQIYEHPKLVPGQYRDPVAAAQALREAGIPGISYLDAGSRRAGQGSRNHVMFDDATIDILRKYGIAGLISGGAAATAAGAQDQGNQ